MLLTLLGTIVPWLLIGVFAWAIFELVKLNGRVLIRLDSLDKQMTELTARPAPVPAQAPAPQPPRLPELPVGKEAPAFELPNLDGNTHSLAEFRGRRLLLVFFNPRCGFCTRMADAIAALPPDGAEDRPTPLLVSTGTVDDNRAMVQEYGLRCRLLLQQQMEVASRYGVSGTPVGYLIDEHGTIASRMTIGADALLALAGIKPTPPALADEATSGTAPCGKCKDGKPCGKCAGKDGNDAAETEGSVNEGKPYDLVDLAAFETLEARVDELTRRGRKSQRLIIVAHSAGQEGVGEDEAAALRSFLRTNPTWLVAHQAADAGRFLVLSRDSRDRKALPTLLARAGTFAKALATHVADGGKKVTAQELESRLEVCTLCDRRTDDLCSACGCVLSTKAGWRSSECPLKKWPALGIAGERPATTQEAERDPVAVS